MKILIIIILFTINSIANQRYELNCKKDILSTSNRILISQIGVIEKTNNNDGEVEKYLKSVDLSKGNPYCAAGQYWCFLQAVINLNLPKVQNLRKVEYADIPIPKTGLANAVFNYAKINGNKTKYNPQIHDLIVWRKTGTPFGHIERIIITGKAGWVETVGFNTEYKIGNIRIEGVFKKKRNVYYALGRLVIRGIVGFKGV
jgi:hypothetical protein